MVSVKQVDVGLFLCRHVKPLHHLDRELVRVVLVKGFLQYSKEFKVFFVVNVADVVPKVQVVRRVKKDFVCDCDVSMDRVRVPDVVSCPHEASLWVAFKIGYFRFLK